MLFKLVALSILTVSLVGCTSSYTSMHKRHLDVQTKMSSTVFLDPVSSDKHTVFLQIRNTSDKPELDLAHRVAEAMEARGYRIVPTLEQANYVLQANVLQIGKADMRAVECVLNQGFETAFSGANAYTSLNHLNTIYIDKGDQGAVYSMVADIQISERTGNTRVMQEKPKSRSKIKQENLNSNIKEVTCTEKTNWKRYQTRILSTATKVNLKFEKAAPELIAGITRSIVGIF